MYQITWLYSGRVMSVTTPAFWTAVYILRALRNMQHALGRTPGTVRLWRMQNRRPMLVTFG